MNDYMKTVRVFDELDIRFNEIIYLPGSIGSGIISDPIETFFDDCNDMVDVSPCLANVEGQVCDYEPLELTSILLKDGYGGFLARVETPILRDGYGDWSCYTAKWLYGDNINQLVNKAVEWVNAKHIEWERRDTKRAQF